MSIEYPILKICPKFIEGAITNRKKFLVASKKANLNMIYLKCIFINKYGIKYKITHAKIGSKLFTLPFMYIDPLYWVEIKYEEIEKLTLLEIKDELILAIKRHRKMKVIREDYIKSIENATNIEEVLMIIEMYP